MTILDLWYGFIVSRPHLVAAFADRDGQPQVTLRSHPYVEDDF